MSKHSMYKLSIILITTPLMYFHSISCMYQQKPPINRHNLPYVLSILEQNPFLRLLEALRSGNIADFTTILSQSTLPSEKIDDLFYEAVARNKVEIAQLLMKRHIVTINRWVIQAAEESENQSATCALLQTHPNFSQSMAHYQHNQ